MNDSYFQELRDENLELRLRKQLEEDMIICEQTGTLPTSLVEKDYIAYLVIHRKLESKYSNFMAENYYTKKHSFPKLKR